MKKLIFAFVATAAMFTAFSFTTAHKSAASKMPLYWVKNPTPTPCVTASGEAGLLIGLCYQAPSGVRCRGVQSVPECVPVASE